MSIRGSLTARTFAKYVKENQLDTLSDKGFELSTLESNLGPKEREQIRPTLKRYIILFLFCLNSGNKSFQWIQVISATKKATILYDVDNYVINIASYLFMLSFVVLSWPACYIIDSFGIRRAVLVASFGTALGAMIKCFSCHEEGIVLLMLGQVAVSLSEQLIFSVPSRLASVWFPDHQVSSAMAFSVVGQQTGVAIGFLVPQWFLNDAETKYDISMGFYYMFLLTFGISVFAFVIDVFLFDEEPEFAPGAARLVQRQMERAATKQPDESVLAKMGKLFCQIGRSLRNKDLVLLSMSYGMNVGLGYTISTLLNQMLQTIWPDDDLIVGNTGFIIIVVGALGLPLWGRFMDKWHAFKLLNVSLTILTMGSLLFFAYVMDFLKSVVVLYVAAAILGFFHTGFVVTGLELAVELTYPEPELVTSSIMNVMPQIFGTIFIIIGSYIVDNYGPLATNGFFLLCLLGALVFLLLSKEKLRRQEAIFAERQKNNSLGANAT